MSHNCFTYGSLMCEDIMAAVTGAHYTHEQATLGGYRRGPVLGQTYPGVIPDAQGRVEGVLYRGVSEDACDLLDAFEGEEYMRVAVQVSLADGSLVPAWAYVFRPEHAHRLGNEDWDFAEFLRTGKARFTAMFLADK